MRTTYRNLSDPLDPIANALGLFKFQIMPCSRIYE